MMAAVLGLLAACGGGGGGSSGELCNPVMTSCEDPVQSGIPANVSSLDLRVSSTTLPTDGSSTVKVYAVVKDSSNGSLADQPITLSASSGTLSTSSGKSDKTGTLEAVFDSNADKTNRTVNITAKAGDLSKTVTVTVQGTKISFGGDASAVLGQTASLSISVKDAANNGVAGATVALSSSLGNPVPKTVVTDSTGSANVSFATTSSGSDQISASGLGTTQTTSLGVSGVNFKFTSPAPGANVVLKACQPVEVLGSGFTFSQVKFSISRGRVFSDSSCSNEQSTVSVSSSVARAYVSSTSAGPATIEAIANDTAGSVAKLSVNFLATVPASVTVQATPSTVKVGTKTSVTALVRDAMGNPVAGKAVEFSAPDGGGQVSPIRAVTDQAGVATTSFIADMSLSGKDSVRVIATADNVNGAAALTVAGAAVNVLLGTDNKIELVENPPRYRKIYGASVTDSNGSPVASQVVTISILGKRFLKGEYRLGLDEKWVQNDLGICPAEDANNNGVIDQGEVGDQDHDGRYEPNGVATVRAPDGSQGGSTISVMTDSSGFATFWVDYFRNFASWAEVELKGSASVSGQNNVGMAVFVLPVSAAEVNNKDAAPSFVNSPFGTQNGDCTSPY